MGVAYDADGTRYVAEVFGAWSRGLPHGLIVRRSEQERYEAGALLFASGSGRTADRRYVMVFVVTLFVWFLLSVPATVIVGRLLSRPARHSGTQSPVRGVATSALTVARG